MFRAIGQPVLVPPGQSARMLERLRLGKATEFDEAWLQQILIENPSILPISDIEPGFSSLVSVAREVPCGHGFIDNLYLTGNGEIIIVEAKLWSNPQARREVVAQTLDYVAALSRMDFEGFERAALQGRTTQEKATKLYDFVTKIPDALDERDFTDAISANLYRGRILALAVGDGVRREAEALGDLLQSHAGAHFTFALVELSAYRTPDTGLLLVPRTLVRTAMVERAVVRIEDRRVLVDAVTTAPRETSGPETISDKTFYEAMATRDQALPDTIRTFLASLEPLGVFVDLKASLNLKWDPGTGKPVNFGYIQRNGQLWTNPLSWATTQDLGRRYAEDLANLTNGVVATNPEGRDPYVSTNGKSAPRIEQILPKYADGWRKIIENVQVEIRRTFDSKRD